GRLLDHRGRRRRQQPRQVHRRQPRRAEGRHRSAERAAGHRQIGRSREAESSWRTLPAASPLSAFLPAIFNRPMPNPFIKQYLMTAGPTPLPPAVSQVQAEPILYHRAPAFIEVYARCLDRLKTVFQTENEVLTFASSGSGGMESAVSNMVGPGTKALVASCGKFGERWAELCEAYGADLMHWDAGWGNRVEPAELDRKL